MAGTGRFDEITGEAGSLDDWRTLITASLPPFQRVENFGGDFHGRLWRYNLDRINVNFIQIESAHHAIHRTEQHVKTTAEPLYVVMFQLEGSSVFSQAGSTAVLHEGDYTVSTSAVPFDWEFFGDFRVMMLRYPQTIIDAAPVSLLPLIGHALTADNPVGRALAPLVRSLADEPQVFRGPVGRRIAQNMVDLFTTSFIANLEERASLGNGKTAPIFIRLTEYIGRNLADRELSPSSIAAANFISLRSLQAVFQDHGTTVTSWIRQKRLGAARHELALSTLATKSIGEIAERWGFEDQAHFTRLFRAEFAETPKQWRQRAFNYSGSADERPMANAPGAAG